MTRTVEVFGGRAVQAGVGSRKRQPLGEKADMLSRLAAAGLPVPPGFVILPADTQDARAAIADGIAWLEAATGRNFGGDERPLLVSVRASPPQAVPGVMASILNLGLNAATAAALAREAGDADGGTGRSGTAFADDAWRRFIQMFGVIALGHDPAPYEDAFDDAGSAGRRGLGAAFRAIADAQPGPAFPDDPRAQLAIAVRAVQDSWQSSRARAYRAVHGIPESPGPAVIVQAMVFGSRDRHSGTGVAFTRDPATGGPGLCGEFVPGGQGDDALSALAGRHPLTRGAGALAETSPEVFDSLAAAAAEVEKLLAAPAEIAFTVERGAVYLLEAVPLRLGLAARLRAAVALAEEGVTGREAALLGVDPSTLEPLLHPTVAADAHRDVLGTGLAASPGAASGAIVFDAGGAEAARIAGRRAILVVAETTPEDVHALQAAAGILTLRGGLTSHAAVVARGLGKPCVSGASGFAIDRARRVLLAGERALPEGAEITVDGSAGQILAGAVPLHQPGLSGDFARLLAWSDGFRRMKVRANADTAAEARTAFAFGAEGIGLCRTEHMFFDQRWIVAVRELILAEDAAGRRDALAKLLPPQRRDIAELFRIADGRPVTIRLLDPPLHEFLPRGEAEMAETARALGVPPERLRRRAAALSEINPMLGLRGCRLAITFPEIIEMQTRAILEAAIEAEVLATGAVAEIMVPLVASRAEMAFVRARIDATADLIEAEHGTRPPYRVGTMIELPRAALRGGAIAENAAFFSFGTNDLTQTTYGISRDDAGSFFGAYAGVGIFRSDPFAAIDRDGVGELMRIAVERGRATRPELTIGICGEHGGEPASIAFCEELGLDYVSCSPYRVPIARLAAAQAAIRAAAAGRPHD